MKSFPFKGKGFEFTEAYLEGILGVLLGSIYSIVLTYCMNIKLQVKQ